MFGDTHKVMAGTLEIVRGLCPKMLRIQSTRGCGKIFDITNSTINTVHDLHPAAAIVRRQWP